MRKIGYMIWPILWTLCLLAIGLYVGVFAGREQDFSENENRMLAGFPDVSAASFADGMFMEGFENYLLDRFPGRERAIGFSQSLRDLISFADYEDFLAVIEADDDPLTSMLDTSDEGEISAPVPPPPQIPPAHSTLPPESSGSSDSSGSSAPSGPVESVEEPEDLPDPVRHVVIPEKPTPVAEDFPTSMGMYMWANGQGSALRQYGRGRIIELTGVLNSYADLLPEGGTLSFTVVPHSAYMIRSANTQGCEALYSNFEQCVYAFSRDNVFVTSTTDILGSAQLRGEYVYFRTDMHWTPYGTHLVYSEMVGAIGHVPTPYSDFEVTVEEPFLGTYYRDNPTSYMRNNADVLELLRPRFPHEFLRITAPGETREIPLLKETARANDRYTVYLGGPAGPWSILRSDNGSTDNCLIITDSFGLAFVPMLSGQYREVHYYDPRYFNANVAGGSVADLIERYEIKDVFVVIGELHSFNSDFMYLVRNHM